jgi:hypothetical protein
VIVPLVLVVGLVLAGATWFVLRWVDRGADEASVDESVEGFRDARQPEGGPELLRPAAGVYTYDASGSEALSVLGTSQSWGASLPATVTTDDRGCWSFLMEFSTNHRQLTTYCPEGRTLTEVAGSTTQTFDFVATAITDVTEFTCDPPGETLRLDAVPGESWEQRCVGRSEGQGTTVTSAGTNTFIGPADVEVGGDTVPALHYRYERTLSGDQSGTDTHDLWFDPATGMILAGTRDTSVTSPSPIGDIRYTESGRFTLTSTEPRT